MDGDDGDGGVVLPRPALNPISIVMCVCVCVFSCVRASSTGDTDNPMVLTMRLPPSCWS